MKITGAVYLILFLGALSGKAAAQTYTVSGHVYDGSTGETLIGSVVYNKALQTGATTNIYGFYSLTLPAGNMELSFSFLGFEVKKLNLKLGHDTTISISLQPKPTQQKEVVIKAGSPEKEQLNSTQMSVIKVPMEQIKRLPSLGGEVDIIKVMQLMPGVKRGGEGQTGMYVRGGGVDQNLILLDEATVYNVGHLFGFFSVFNNDALKDVTLIKGGFPAQYGGRISSILDIRMKEGNMNKYSAEGGIGLLSSRLTLQGPLLKDKMSFLVSARRSYIDKVFAVVGMPVPYYFYDLNAKVNYKLSEKDRFFYSSYLGNDVLSLPKPNGQQGGDTGQAMGPVDFGFTLGNFTNTLRWNHIYTPKLFSNVSLIYTRFKYDINGKFMDNSIFIGSKIRDLGLKADYDFYENPHNHIKFGGSITNHIFRPNIVSATGEITQVIKNSGEQILNTQEAALYLSNDQDLSDKIVLNYGVRMSSLLSQEKIYAQPEPRFSTTYKLNEKNSIKASYSRMAQYMHLVSSSSIALPTDLWYPVTPKIKPQISDQWALGYTRNLEKIKTMITVEGYYKGMKNLIEYRPGAVLILNDNYEDELISGKGDAFGFEAFINKSKGRFNGWAGYSLSWARRQFAELNDGKPYYAKYDRRHDISLVGNYEISSRVSISAIWVYATGQRLTGRTGQYASVNPNYSGLDILPIYTGKNDLRFSPSTRLDLNLTIKRKANKRREGEWNIGAYNVLNRTQPYKVDVVPDPQTGRYRYMQKGLFGFTPSIAYNFKF